MEFVSKRFDELTAGELFEILRSRAEIFVVEQSCAYQDPDDHDPESLHVFCMENGRVTAYLRAFPLEKGVVRLGRVMTLRHGTGLGGKLLKAGIALARREFAPKRICIEAQCYATGFYAREGFEICSDEFLEDGIPHVRMVLGLK